MSEEKKAEQDERVAFEAEWKRSGWGDADTKNQCFHFWQARAASTSANVAQKRDDTGRLTSDYEPTPLEIKVCRDAICREFGNNGTDGYYIRILKAVHGAAQAVSGEKE